MSLNKFINPNEAKPWMNINCNQISSSAIKSDNLTLSQNDTQTNPLTGEVKLYAKTDGKIYQKNSIGVESQVGGGYELQVISQNDLEDLEFKAEYEKRTWSNGYEFYNYYADAYVPKIKARLNPLDTETFVSNESELDSAITAQTDNIYIAQSFPITSTKTINFPCKIWSEPSIKYEISGDIVGSLFIVTVDNVWFDNVTLTNSSTSSVASCISFQNNFDNNAVHSCVINTNETGIVSNNNQIEIYNNEFNFIGSADSHRYIILQKTTKETKIYDNKFASNGVVDTPNTQIMLLTGTTENFINGHLIVYNNISVGGSVQRMGIIEVLPSNFSFTFVKNTILTNTDFFILYGDGCLDGVKEITANGNEVFLIPSSAGFKGLIGFDSTQDINYVPVIKASNNILPSNLRSDYFPIPNSSEENPILCSKSNVINVISKINPPRVI